ncbi:hypothetical protein JL722_14471 [Aureococcus anophagefferens]|nr:hypothetical protein JL722_14471 [Aureococcus anophagefferens]
MLRAAAATAAATAAACLTLLQRNYDATENEPLAPGGSVVVVGAGVVGVSTADELSRRGFRVTVLEASPGIAGAASASHGNACTLGVSGKWQSLADAATLLETLQAASPSPGAAPPPPDAPFETRHAFHATNKFVDASVLGDPWFYAWGLAMLKGLAAGAPAMEAAWRASNEAAQRALIARAADVGFRGIRVDGSEKPLRGYSITARVTARRRGVRLRALLRGVDDATVRFTSRGELGVADAAGAHGAGVGAGPGTASAAAVRLAEPAVWSDTSEEDTESSMSSASDSESDSESASASSASESESASASSATASSASASASGEDEDEASASSAESGTFSASSGGDDEDDDDELSARRSGESGRAPCPTAAASRAATASRATRRRSRRATPSCRTSAPTRTTSSSPSADPRRDARKKGILEYLGLGGQKDATPSLSEAGSDEGDAYKYDFDDDAAGGDDYDFPAARTATNPSRRASRTTSEKRLEMAFAFTTRESLCRIQPLVWVVLTKLQNSLARSNRSESGRMEFDEFRQAVSMMGKVFTKEETDAFYREAMTFESDPKALGNSTERDDRGC